MVPQSSSLGGPKPFLPSPTNNYKDAHHPFALAQKLPENFVLPSMRYVKFRQDETSRDNKLL